MNQVQAELNEFWESETLDEVREILRITAHWMAIPLFAVFWIADIIYAPEMKWHFLAIRSMVIPICFLVTSAVRRANNLIQAQQIASLYAISLASGINLMIFLLPDPGTGYYAGLNLVAIGCLSFIPFSRRYYLTTAAGIYLPYYLIVITKSIAANEWKSVFVNSFFIISSICMCFLIRFFHEALRRNEIQARHNLKLELEGRDKIIRTKTDEAVKLNALSAQFSPQLVESIRSGKVKFDEGASRASICAIFIDIVNSTEKVTGIDKDQVERTLSRFLDDTIRIMLKYDITVDKFLGDGIMGFCNAPMERTDYTNRVVSAALEIREKIGLEREFFIRNWQGELQIRVGIAKGFANVGFYGSKKYFKSYTAIGPVMNLAARLCASAMPGQIITDYDVYELIQDNFETEFLGRKSLKGFELGSTQVYEIKGSRIFKALNPGMSECPKCGSILNLETNEFGQFVFMCKTCQIVVENLPAKP